MSIYSEYDTYEDYLKNREPKYKQQYCIFIIENENNLVKFGITKKEFKERLGEIRSSELTTLTQWYSSKYYSNAEEILKMLCKQFALFKYKGNWFDIDYQEGLKELKRLCRKIGNPNPVQVIEPPSDFEKRCFETFKKWDKII